jgi:hypothetical protein
MHVLHNKDPSGVQLVDSVLGRNTNSANKQRSSPLDDDVNKLVQLAAGVITLEGLSNRVH